MSELEHVFKSFCAFGAKDSTLMMDNAKFSKLCRDTKILDKKLTSTDVDIIFTRVKAKTERKISFKQFVDAVKLLAEIKYPGDTEGVRKLESRIIEGKGPSTSGATKTTSGAVVDRLTDTSKYTGSHKQRFDESGKGRGLEGRDAGGKGVGTVTDSVAGRTAYVEGYKHAGTYGKK